MRIVISGNRFDARDSTRRQHRALKKDDSKQHQLEIRQGEKDFGYADVGASPARVSREGANSSAS